MILQCRPQENTVNALLREKDELAGERDNQLTQISGLRSEIAGFLTMLRAKDAERVRAAQDIQSLKESVSSKKTEQVRCAI